MLLEQFNLIPISIEQSITCYLPLSLGQSIEQYTATSVATSNTINFSLQFTLFFLIIYKFI